MVMSILHSGTLTESIVAALSYDSGAPLSYLSDYFALALLIFGCGYMALRRRVTLRTMYVVIFSLFVYYKMAGVALLLLLGVAISDYLIAWGVAHRLKQGRSPRGWVALSAVINIAILTYFTATNFIVHTINDLYGSGTLNWEPVVKVVGVSFFVFQSLAYVIDVSRGTIAPLRRFESYLFLLSFFPKLVCGPLVKARDFIPQIESPEVGVSREDMGRGVTLIARGLVKFMLLSQVIGTLFVGPAFAGTMGDGGMVALLAIYGFTMQLYCDFSGFSEFAIGLALIMGFRLPDNFDAPYKAATITEFWRRWHISLSSWLREYLYISLGGNRKGRLRTYLNLFLTMFLGGLWHGVSLPFMAWGALHGIALALHKVWLAVVPGAKSVGEQMRPLWRLLATLLTLHIVAFGWLLFNAPDMATVGRMLGSIANNMSLSELGELDTLSLVAVGLIVVGYMLHYMPRSANGWLQRSVTRSGFVGQWVVIVATLWCVSECNALLGEYRRADVTARVERTGEAAESAGGGLPAYGAF